MLRADTTMAINTGFELSEIMGPIDVIKPR